MAPRLPLLDTLTGKELVRVGSEGKPALTSVDAIGQAADRSFAAEIAQIRADIASLRAGQFQSERITGSVVTAGTAVTVNFAKPFAAPPAVIPVPGWSGDQFVEATATEITATGAKIIVKRSRGTLVLSAGPFENAPAGTAFVVVALGLPKLTP
ncbi:hypothetical protein DYI37_03900 [Fulvimarina endophytica]|uniref:Uncharacterized protein n=1 Tax=Fulvimarina endophytica TaxID=2293836 RepID=A0A371X709_9HYPH|nr:hypothetical protein [Fulvimarina endophytica]RFC65019.1 hypothetical protein DYI37_03900 [Fulvimarina endophytica]